ncbi:MAG: DUF2207 domain-containing protein [Erysipelotrichaceae bacterium]
MNRYKGLKKYLIAFMLMLTLLLSNVNVMADNVDDAYYYDEIFVEYQVKDDNTFIVTETMDTVFKFDKHGITRTIPHNFKLERADGSSNDVYGTIENVKCSDEYEVSINGRDTVVRIGDPDKTVIGKKKYVLKYEVSVGKDKLANIDEFYRNIIGTDYNTHTNKLSFKITMPKKFDSSKIGFSHGYKNSTGFDEQNLKYEVNGNVITGSYTKLQPYQGLTIRVELDEGYFANAKDIGSLPIVYYILSITLGIVGLILVLKFCRNPKPIAPIEFEAPEGYTCLDVAIVAKLKLISKDFFTFIIHLANLGYIEIEEIESKGRKKNFQLTKLKAYEGDSEIERRFLSALFLNGDVSTLKEIGEKCGKQLNNVRTSFISGNKKVILDPINLKIKLALVAIVLLEILVLFLANTFVFKAVMTIGLFIVASLFFNLLLLLIVDDSMSISGYILPNVFMVFGAYMLFIELNSVAPYMTVYYMMVLVISIILVMLITKCKKREDHFNEVYGHILGFKEFLKTAEKDRLETLVNDNPNYFYDMLPFAYVLGVSDEWIDNFADIEIINPSYYHGDSFYHSFNDFSRSASSNMRSSSSGSGSSGGSSSGGGGGGGGSSSW